MIKIIIDRKLNWVDVKEEICSEKCRRRTYFCGIKLWDKDFKIEHKVHDGAKKSIGFGE